jgi:two-component system, chemotaxis family, sensor kinase CheA
MRVCRRKKVSSVPDPPRSLRHGKPDMTRTRRTDAARSGRSDRGLESAPGHSFLLFRGEGGGLHAMPLELVSCIAQFEPSQIARAGERLCVCWRGRTMPLVPFDEAWPRTALPKRTVLVFADSGREMGLIVNKAADVVRGEVVAERTPGRGGLFGRIDVEGRSADIVDIAPFASRAFAGEKPPAAPRHGDKRRALLIDGDAIFQNLISPLMAAAGWRVVVVETVVEAIAMLEGKERFDLAIGIVGGRDAERAALEKLGGDSRRDRMPTILLSPRDDGSDCESGSGECFGYADWAALPAFFLSVVERLSNGSATRRKAS